MTLIPDFYNQMVVVNINLLSEDDVWYKASELVDVLGVRETRTKALLRALVEDGLLVDNGAIKGRKYKKMKV